MKLKNEPELAVAEQGPLLFAESEDVIPTDSNQARRGTIKTAKDVQKRALAGSRRAYDDNHFTLFDLDINAL
jgi:hypothetical protein